MVLKWIFRALVVAVLLATPIAWVAYYYPEKFLCVDSGPATADVIVVLGGGRGERPLRAAELFRQHAAPRVLISGFGDDEINRQILLANGVPARAIEVEGGSKTTRENALFTLKRLRAEHVHRVILVTTWYHARRALRTFEHYAPDLGFYMRPSYYSFERADWSLQDNNRKMRLEFVKLPGYWARYGVNPF